MLESQPTAMPTNKTLTMALGNVATLPLILPAVQEVWPQIAPAVLTGPAATAAVAAFLSTLVSVLAAYFVRDRLGSPT